MSESEYDFNLIDDFNGNIDYAQFQHEINSNVIITANATCTHINSDGDDIYVFFDSTLGNTQQDCLHTIVSNHVPIPKKNLLSHCWPLMVVRETSYRNIATLYFTVDYTKPIKSIELVGYIEQDSSMGSIQFVYRNSNQLIASHDFNNTSPTLILITDILYQPLTSGIIDVSLKSSAFGKFARVDEIIFWN